MSLTDPPKRQPHRGTRIHRDQRGKYDEEYYDRLIEEGLMNAKHLWLKLTSHEHKYPINQTRVSVSGEEVVARCKCGRDVRNDLRNYEIGQAVPYDPATGRISDP